MKTLGLILLSVLTVHCAPLQESSGSTTPSSTHQKNADAQRPHISTLPATINLQPNTQHEDGLVLSPSENRPQINQGHGPLIGGQEQRPKRETQNSPPANTGNTHQSKHQLIGGDAGVLHTSTTQVPENQRPKRDSESQNPQSGPKVIGGQDGVLHSSTTPVADSQRPKTDDEQVNPQVNSPAQSRPHLIGGQAGVLHTSTTQVPEVERPKRDSESQENTKVVAPLSDSSQNQKGHVAPAVYSSRPQLIGGQAGVLQSTTEAQHPKRETNDSKPSVQTPQVIAGQAHVHPSSQSNQGNVGGVPPAATNPSGLIRPSVLTRDVPRVKPIEHA